MEAEQRLRAARKNASSAGVKEFSGAIRSKAGGGISGVQPVNDYDNPVGLTFDLAGNLYVSDAHANGIYRIGGFPQGTMWETVEVNRMCRGVAQPGSVLAWGASGRPFKSARPDQYIEG